MVSSTWRMKWLVRMVTRLHKPMTSLANSDTAWWWSSGAHGRRQQQWLARSAMCAAVAEVNGKESRVGRELGGCRGRGGERGLGVVATWDTDATRTWRRRLHGLRVERWWRAVDSAGARWQAVTEPPLCRCTHVGARWSGHAAMGRRGPLARGPCH
jgi:hypothetical protein